MRDVSLAWYREVVGSGAVLARRSVCVGVDTTIHCCLRLADACCMPRPCWQSPALLAAADRLADSLWPFAIPCMRPGKDVSTPCVPLLMALTATGAEGLLLHRAKAIIRTRVEPKTFFANERTFLQWLQISVLIMFMGLSLLGTSSLAGGSSGAGGCSESATSIGCKASKVLSNCLVQPAVSCDLQSC